METLWSKGSCYIRVYLVKKAGLAIAGILAVAIPMILGVTNAPALRAQAQPNIPRFEVASIRRHASQEQPVLVFMHLETPLRARYV